ncbi:spermidine synthase, partial [Candidatus Falkowbacteria bacterium]|nr:spermidine synthase [Candidatus Falkowbacteria bacterium]
MKNSKLTLIILILFFFSGLASLIYEVIWARKLGLVFGTTSYAISTILAVFMAGLALGSFLFGRVVDKLKEPKNFLFLIGLLGIGEGTYAIFTPSIFKLIEKLQLILVGEFTSPLNLNLLRFSLSFLALILPTTLCGGTLPVLSKFLIRLKEEVGKKFALL